VRKDLGARRRVRYTRLVEAWPDCPPSMDPDKAILAAPADACLEAMAAEVDHYSELLQDERELVNRLTAELNGIRVAARTLGALFDEPTP
jgi:hypothetical protein